MEEKKYILAKKKLDDLFVFEMIGFSEQYVHDFKMKKALFVDTVSGGAINVSELTQPQDFEMFVEFCKEMLIQTISVRGDGHIMFPEEFDGEHSFKEIVNKIDWEIKQN